MLDTVCLEFHGKRHTDFDLKRIARAQAQGFDEPVTAYLCGVFITARAGVGIVFGHQSMGASKMVTSFAHPMF